MCAERTGARSPKSSQSILPEFVPETPKEKRFAGRVVPQILRRAYPLIRRTALGVLSAVRMRAAQSRASVGLNKPNPDARFAS